MHAGQLGNAAGDHYRRAVVFAVDFALDRPPNDPNLGARWPRSYLAFNRFGHRRPGRSLPPIPQLGTLLRRFLQFPFNESFHSFFWHPAAAANF